MTSTTAPAENPALSPDPAPSENPGLAQNPGLPRDPGQPAGLTTAVPASPHRTRAIAVLTGAGLLLAGLNLRMGVASVSPVLTEIRADLGLGESAASLLTTIPVIAFGAFAFLTPALTRRLGHHRLLVLTMAVLALGILVRLAPNPAALFAGTLLVGAAIAVANVVMPAAIKHDFAHRAGLMMGLYSAALFAGAAAAAGLTVPLLPVLGGGWRAGLAIWAVPAVVALLVLLPLVRGRFARSGLPSGERPAVSLRRFLRDPIAWSVTAVMGLQSLSYYACLTWLPTLLRDHGMDAAQAGWMLSFSAFPGILASLVMPMVATRLGRPWVPMVLAVGLTLAAYAGLAASPTTGTYLWMTLLGLGQGASISLSLSFVVWRSPDAHHTGQLSTMAQGFGYLVAGLGPLVLGVLHGLTGGWTAPLVLLAAVAGVQLWAGFTASREGHVGD